MSGEHEIQYEVTSREVNELVQIIRLHYARPSDALGPVMALAYTLGKMAGLDHAETLALFTSVRMEIETAEEEGVLQ